MGETGKLEMAVGTKNSMRMRSGKQFPQGTAEFSLEQGEGTFRRGRGREECALDRGPKGTGEGTAQQTQRVTVMVGTTLKLV